MLLVSAVATVVALVLAGSVVAGLLGRFVVEGLDRRLDAELTLLASAVDGEGRIDRARLAEHASVLDGGPGWRWRIAGPDGNVGSADFSALDVGPPPPHGRGPDRFNKGPRPMEGASEQGVPVHARQVSLETRRGGVTITAAAPRDVVRRPIRGAVVPLLAALAGIAALLTAAMLVQLRIGLRPLRRLQEQVAAIRDGRASRVDEDQPTELQPLAAELNALAADTRAALSAARGSAANMSHALKTPVATLAIALRDQPGPAEQVARIHRTIRHHLARARADAVNRRTATPLCATVTDVMAAVTAIHRDRHFQVANEVADDLSVAIDAQDLEELLGNVLDNAARFAEARIAIVAVREGRRVIVTVSDDGPGIPPSERGRVAQPGMRLDEQGQGHGFGLSIVAELVALYGGSLMLGEVAGGGLAVSLTLPAAD
nr:HAMP domain-containing sensor histidine kinase [Sphingomonas aerophila]